MGLTIHDRISPGLARCAAKIADRRPILEAMGLQIVSITAQAFNDPSQRVAEWAPLKARTLAEKIKAGKSTAILKRNMVLAKSFRVLKLTNSAVTVGTDRPYAGYHQFGAPKAHIPARPMMPFIGGPDDARLAEFARKKVEATGQAKVNSILKQAAG